MDPRIVIHVLEKRKISCSLRDLHPSSSTSQPSRYAIYAVSALSRLLKNGVRERFLHFVNFYYEYYEATCDLFMLFTLC